MSLLLFVWVVGLIEERFCYPNWRQAYPAEEFTPARKMAADVGGRRGVKEGSFQAAAGERDATAALPGAVNGQQLSSSSCSSIPEGGEGR